MASRLQGASSCPAPPFARWTRPASLPCKAPRAELCRAQADALLSGCSCFTSLGDELLLTAGSSLHWLPLFLDSSLPTPWRYALVRLLQLFIAGVLLQEMCRCQERAPVSIAPHPLIHVCGLNATSQASHTTPPGLPCCHQIGLQMGLRRALMQKWHSQAGLQSPECVG